MESRALLPHQPLLMNPPAPCCPQAAPPHPQLPNCCPRVELHPGPVWVAKGGQGGQELRSLRPAPLPALGA